MKRVCEVRLQPSALESMQISPDYTHLELKPHSDLIGAKNYTLQSLVLSKGVRIPVHITVSQWTMHPTQEPTMPA